MTIMVRVQATKIAFGTESLGLDQDGGRYVLDEDGSARWSKIERGDGWQHSVVIHHEQPRGGKMLTCISGADLEKRIWLFRSGDLPALRIPFVWPKERTKKHGSDT